MKKLSVSIKVLFLLFFVMTCTCNTMNAQKKQAIKKLIKKTKTLETSSFLGSYYKGNYVWGGAMNLAWNEMNEKIIKGKLQLDTDDKVALKIVEKLNFPVVSKQDFDSESYYIKSGYGQKTITEINNEIKLKFPNKSFPKLDIKLSETDLISYAYFLKEMEYENKFDVKNIDFKGKTVKGFYNSKYSNQTGNVEVLFYKNDDNFIIRIRLKDQKDQLILAKGFDMTKPELVLIKINSMENSYIPTITDEDSFQAPLLNLDYSRDYKELVDKYLLNIGFENYKINAMFENIKFKMNEIGAKVENEAVIQEVDAIAFEEHPIVPKNLYLNKPYWVIMKRANSKKPYFILGINNDELMEKVKD